MTTVDELEVRILHPLRDSTQEFFGEPELLDYINNAIVDLSARQRLFRNTATINTLDSSIAMTPDMLQVRWARDAGGVEVAWLDESTFFEYQNRVPAPSQFLATIYGNKIWIHPAVADGEAWTVGYYAIPPALTAGTDDFPLRRLWEEKVVRYCRSECWYKLGETQMGDRERQFYEEGLRPSEAITDHEVPGQLNFARSPNVFDNGRDAIHLGG